MGAATALLHGERDPSIAGMVLDSAFTGEIPFKYGEVLSHSINLDFCLSNLPQDDCNHNL